MRFGSRVKLAAAALWLLTALPAWSQQLYRFGIDQDRLAGAPDFSYLNHPLTAADRVFVRDGHFYTVGSDLTPNTADDQRIRFFGVNLAFGANFPESGDAARVALRLRRLGVNLVRLHHMDSSPDPAGNPSIAGSLLTDGPYPTFNDVSVQRLRGFLTALAAEGIYADLNLHVGYTFRPSADQVPALPGQSMPSQSKPLHIFYPRMVQLQEAYAQQAIEKLRLQNDPALAVVEIDNETSLVQAWQSGELDPLLVGDYRSALQAQWNQWLAAAYPATAALTAAWGTGYPDGPNLLSGVWILEQGHGTPGTLSVTTVDGVPTAQVQVGQRGSGDGWLFLKQTGFHLTAGKRYIWSFEARADVPTGQTVRTPVSVMRDVSPWDGILHSTIYLTSQWQTFNIAVSASFAIQDSGRASLDVEYAPGAVYARNMKLVEAGQRGLAEGESIEAGNVSLLNPGEGATPARRNDYVRFLVNADRGYMNAMRDAVRAQTGALVPIAGTQMGYGGLSLLDSQDGLDYQDNHFYIDHYNFPNTAWDGLDWRIRDAAAAGNAWSSFLDMAWAREAGRPYTVSEYNEPWPNTHGAEIDPSLAAFASFQDWDAIMHFAYSHGRNWDAGAPNGFNINGDWTKFPVIGQSAWLFRTGAVRPGASALDAPVSAAQRIQAAASGGSVAAWIVSQAGIPREAAFVHRVELAKDSAAAVPESAKSAPVAPYVSDTGELTFDKNAKVLLLDAPSAAGVFGGVDLKSTAGPMDVELAPSGRGFVSALLTALDRRPVASSASLLLSIPGYSLRALPDPGNRQPAAPTAQPQQLRNYPGSTDWWTLDPANSANPAKPSGDMNGGWTPTFMERVEAWITVRTRARAIAVYALDGAGAVAGALPPSEITRVAGGFRIHVNGAGQPQSPWFVIAAVQRPERFLRR